MSLIECGYCRGEYEDVRHNCAHCGAPRANPMQGGHVGNFGQPTLPPPPPSPAGQVVASAPHPAPQQHGTPQYGAPVYAPQPYGGVAYASKSRVAYVLLGLFLGGLGIHNFYAGRTGIAVTQLLLMVLLGWTGVVALAVCVWVVVEVITVTHDSSGRRFS